MKKIAIIGICMLLMLDLSAHDPLSARFDLKETQTGAILDIYLSQSGVHAALVKGYPDIDFEQIAAKDYKALIVKYLKSKIRLEANGQLLEIGAGAIKLGSHQTDLKLQIVNYPLEVNVLTVSISAFEENGRHQSVFWWYTPETAKRIILSSRNNYKADIELYQVHQPETAMAGFERILAWLVFLVITIPTLALIARYKKLKTA